MASERKKKVRTTSPEKQPKTDRMHFRVTPELKEALQEAAAEDHRSVSQYVELALMAELRKRGKLH